MLPVTDSAPKREERCATHKAGMADARGRGRICTSDGKGRCGGRSQARSRSFSNNPVFIGGFDGQRFGVEACRESGEGSSSTCESADSECASVGRAVFLREVGSSVSVGKLRVRVSSGEGRQVGPGLAKSAIPGPMRSVGSADLLSTRSLRSGSGLRPLTAAPASQGIRASWVGARRSGWRCGGRSSGGPAGGRRQPGPGGSLEGLGAAHRIEIDPGVPFPRGHGCVLGLRSAGRKRRHATEPSEPRRGTTPRQANQGAVADGMSKTRPWACFTVSSNPLPRA